MVGPDEVEVDGLGAVSVWDLGILVDVWGGETEEGLAGGALGGTIGPIVTLGPGGGGPCVYKLL